jgi:hypothetical protein
VSARNQRELPARQEGGDPLHPPEGYAPGSPDLVEIEKKIQALWRGDQAFALAWPLSGRAIRAE